MKCNSCGNEYAYHIRTGKYKKSNGEYERWEVCDRCGSLPVEGIPDVSDVHEPYFDEHLANAQHPDGQWIYSRKQKAEVLKSMGLREKRESTIPFIKDVEARRKYFRSKFG